MKTKSAILFYIFISLYSFTMGISMLAIPWYYTTKNELSSFNISYAAVTFASLFFGYLFGTLLDTYNRKHILFYYLLPLALLLMVPIIIGPNHYVIILIFALQFMGYVLFYPAIYSIIKNSFHPTKYILHTTIVEFLGQSTVIIAATVGVLLLNGIEETFFFLGRIEEIKLEAFSLEKIFMLSGMLLSLSLIFLYFMEYKKRNNTENNKNYWPQFSAGIQYMIIEKKYF